MSYESPINLVIGQFRMEQEKRIEGEVFKAIQDYGINIDKDELIRALKYDREQYDKGYEDGASEVAAEIFAEIANIIRYHDELAERDGSEYGELIVSDIGCALGELKKKYTEGGKHET